MLAPGRSGILRFDGSELSEEFRGPAGIWEVSDIDGDGSPEFVVDYSNPFLINLHLGGVREWRTGIVRRNEEGYEVLDAVVLSGHVPGEVRGLVDEALSLAEADLWREAVAAIAEAARIAPGSDDVFWIRELFETTATARVVWGGDEAQPFVTHVVAGEYEAAVDLMRAHSVSYVFQIPTRRHALNGQSPSSVSTVYTVVFTIFGPDRELLPGLVTYAGRAIAQRPQLAAAYAVRALGRFLPHEKFGDRVAGTGDLPGAAADLACALLLEPEDRFYQEAYNYLVGRTHALSP